MCIIGIAHERMLTENEIRNCFTNNKDGAGIAWSTEDGKVHVQKGFMDVESLLNYYLAVDIPLPHVIHFRTATSGDVSREMCHPYRITPMSELVVEEDTEHPVLFHNGVIFDWKNLLLNMVTSKQIDAMPKGPMNDTRMAAIMASIPTIGPDIFEVLSGKFVMITPDGNVTRWGQFDDADGVLFSNDAYKRVVYVYGNGACNYGQNDYYGKNWNKGGKKHSKIVDLTDSEWAEKFDDYPKKLNSGC